MKSGSWDRGGNRSGRRWVSLSPTRWSGQEVTLMLSGRRAVQVEGVTGFKVLKLNPSILQRLFLKQFAST